MYHEPSLRQLRHTQTTDNGRQKEVTLKKHTIGALIVLALAMHPAPLAAEEQTSIETQDYALKLKARTFVPTEGIDQALQQTLATQGTERVHFILQIRGPATPERIELLRDKSVELLLPLRESGWFASAARGTNLTDHFIRYAGPLLPTDKIDPILREDELPLRIQSGKGKIIASVRFHKDVPSVLMEAVIQEFDPVPERLSSRLVEIDILPDNLLNLAAYDAVMWIEPGNPFSEPLNDLVRQATHADIVQNAQINQSIINYDLSGSGVQVAVFDTGVDPDHDDFQGRILRTSGTGGHGTHVGGIVGSSGLLSNVSGGGSAYQFRGMAPECEIASFGISSTLTDYEEAVNTLGVEVTNNSWVQSVSCNYDNRAVDLDDFVGGAAGRPICILFGTGNNGLSRQYGDLVGYYSSFTSAKNTIAIGSTNSDSDIRSGFSSMGPTFDLRLKPDVVAPGCRTGSAIYSTQPNDSYGYSCGTSMSGPAACGNIALLYEQYATTYGVNLDVDGPLPSTMKAIVVQTAKDLVHLSPSASEGNNPDTGDPVFYHEGPDYATGYGLVNAEDAANLIVEKRLREFTVRPLYNRRLKLNIPPGLPELKVTIAWDDLPGNPAESETVPKLVNNLDLTLKAPDSTLNYPWVVQAPPHEAVGGSMTGIDPITPADIMPATRGVDSVNNVEQVLVENPDEGEWTLRILAGGTLAGNQSVSVAANVPLPLMNLSISCAAAPVNNRLEVTATAENLLNSDTPIGARFTIIECDSSENTFRDVGGRTLTVFASRTRTIPIRLPLGLSTGCNLQLRIEVYREGTGEVLAQDTCTFQIP